MIWLGVTGLAPWGAVSTVQAATATASNDDVSVTATGAAVLAVQSVGTDFDVIVSGGIAPVTVTLTARSGATLVKPSSGSSSQLPFEYEVGFPLNPGEDVAEGEVRKVILKVDLLADTNRDGVIDEDDQESKDGWKPDRGAIYNVNFDRDGINTLAGLPMPDAVHFGNDGLPDFEDYTIVNDVDEADIAPLKIRLMDELPPDFSVYLCVDEEESIRAMHLYKRIQGRSAHYPGESAIWGSCKHPNAVPAPWAADVADVMALERDVSKWTNPNHPEYDAGELNIDNGYAVFGIEGLVLRGMKVPGGTLDHGKFSGEIRFRLEVRDSVGNVVCEDSILMRVAPWLTISHQEAAQALYIAHMGNVNYVTRNAPLHGPDYRYVGLWHSPDIMQVIDPPYGTEWFQDHAEIGYTQRPGGPKQHLIFRLPHTDKDGPRAPAVWLYDHLLGPNVGIFHLGTNLWNGGVLFAGDFGGNIETLPPSADQPLGVIVMGDTLSPGLKSFLQAQELQVNQHSFDAPAKWLSVGHIDEYSSFLSADAIGRRVLHASSRLAIETLEDTSKIPVNQRHTRVFFATDTPNVVSGVLVADTASAMSRIIHTGRDHIAEGDGIEVPGTGRVGWLRFYSGNARGQVARVRLDNGFAVVDDEEGKEWHRLHGFTPVIRWALWDTGVTMAQYQDATTKAAPMSEWMELPKTSDKYVIVNSVKRWATYFEDADTLHGTLYFNGMPAVITVHELLSPESALFRSMNREHVQSKLNQAEAAIRAAATTSPPRFIYVPSLFFSERIVENNIVTVTDRSAYSFNPGPSNLQPVSGRLYVPRQFGPFDNAGDDIYERIIRNTVQEHVFFVDGWDGYHVTRGQIHCGTNVKRDIPDISWWEHIPAAQP